MRIGQRGKFIGHEFYEGLLQGGELFTVNRILEYLPKENNILFEAKLDTGETEFLLTEQVELFTKEDDIKTLKILANKYPNEAKEIINSL